MTTDKHESATEDAERGASEPVSTLRGASAAVDPRRAARVVVGLVLLALAVVGIVFIVVGTNKNDQINELKGQGVQVTYVVSKCLGQLGGSGSNAVGYSCRGSYEIDGHRYVETLPGSSNYGPGTRVAAISVPSDPTLVSTPAIVASEQSSWTVFIVPSVLLGAFAALLLVVVLRRRRPRSSAASR